MGVTELLSNEKVVRHLIIFAVIIMILIILAYTLFYLHPTFEQVKDLLMLFVGLITGFIAGGKMK